jgi:hypothetical protein
MMGNGRNLKNLDNLALHVTREALVPSTRVDRSWVFSWQKRLRERIDMDALM